MPPFFDIPLQGDIFFKHLNQNKILQKEIQEVRYL